MEAQMCHAGAVVLLSDDIAHEAQQPVSMTTVWHIFSQNGQAAERVLWPNINW